VINNLLIGPGTVISGGTVGRMSNNVMGTTADVVSATTFDYHLAGSSAAIGAGVDPAGDGTMSYRPISQYVHPHALEARNAVDAIDVGAYEFGNVPDAGVSDGGFADDAAPLGDAGLATDAGHATDAAAHGDGGTGTSSGGCCHVAGGGTRGGSGAGLFALFALALVARRRYSRSSGCSRTMRA